MQGIVHALATGESVRAALLMAQVDADFSVIDGADAPLLAALIARRAAAGAPAVLLAVTPTGRRAESLGPALEAGRYGKPKVTSASAVIRYAVRHLAEHMTPEQVVAAIREAAPETSNQGRIRL